MAHPYHHSLSSVRKWGGEVEAYLPVHNFLDATKSLMADFRHRALRHHAEGIFLCEAVLGTTITLADGRRIPTRYIAEQHVKEDLGMIPSAVDWLRAIAGAKWMNPRTRLSQELEAVPVPPEFLGAETFHTETNDSG